MRALLSTPSPCPSSRSSPSPSPCQQQAYMAPSSTLLRQESSPSSLPASAPPAVEISYAWDNRRYPSPSLARELETLGDLRLPVPAQVVDSSSLAPLDRFFADDTNRTLMNPATTAATGPPPSYPRQLSAGIAWSHRGESTPRYQTSYPDSADAASVISYDCPPPPYAPWGSAGDDGYPHADDRGSASSPSPVYHSHVGRSPSDRLSPHDAKHGSWGGQYVSDGAADVVDIGAVDPSLAQGKAFVSLCTVQLKPDEVDRGADEDSRERSHHHNHHHHHHHHSHNYDPEITTGHTRWEDAEYMYSHMPQPMEVEPSPSSSPTSTSVSASSSNHTSPRLPSPGVKRRQPRRVDMMRPYRKTAAGSAEAAAAAAAGGVVKSHRGRGAGKKTKERQVCPDHPDAHFNHPSDLKKHLNQHHFRPFICVFEFAYCHQTFGSKNEWKRHVNSQHLQTDFWSCDFPGCADRRAIFNRKDLFGQHIKRMHHSTPDEHQATLDRCKIRCREPPARSRCVYCGKDFKGKESWEMRMEHVGQHYEKGGCKGYAGGTGKCGIDGGLIEWSLRNRVIEKSQDGSYRIINNGKNSIVVVGEEHRRAAEACEEETDAEGYDDI